MVLLRFYTHHNLDECKTGVNGERETTNCEDVKEMNGEEEDRSAGRLVVTKFPDGT